jgi:tetratricopeptide (TPR) repeat protein
LSTSLRTCPHRAAAALLCAALLIVTASAQESAPASRRAAERIEFTVTGEGPAATVAGNADGVPILEVLARLAHGLECALELSDPDFGENLSDSHVDIDLDATAIAEFLDYLGAACDLRVEYDDVRKKLAVGPVPAAEDPATASILRRSAVEILRRETAVAAADAPRAAELLVQCAEIAAADGDYAGALADLETFLQRFSTLPAGPTVCLRAANMALNAKRPSDARRHCEYFLDKWADHADHVKIECISARAFRDQGREQEAILILERIDRAVARGAVREREGLVAELLLAETYSMIGDDKLAVTALSRIPGRHSRANLDLLRRVPFYRGLCLTRLGQHDDAILDFVVGAHSAPTPRLRALSLVSLCESYLARSSPLEALGALRIARSVGIPGDQELRALLAEAKSFEGLGLDTHAIGSYVTALEKLPARELAAADRERWLRTFLEGIATLLADGQDFDAARGVIEKLRGASELTAPTTYLLALCHFRLGRWQEALRELETIRGVETDPALALDLRRLEGDCHMRLARYEAAIRTWKDGEEK